MKNLITIFCFLFLFVGIVTAGFDEYGYNDNARLFVGTGGSWCDAKGFNSDCSGYSPMLNYANDKLVMKWNSEWERGNSEGWTDPNGYNAWENNEWNGRVPGGSGEVWHYKIVWVNNCPNGDIGPGGGDCIWGQFEIIMDQGTDANHDHIMNLLSNPAGYGAYFSN